MSEEIPLDYKTLLFQILNCVGSEEGIIYERAWVNYGVAPEDQARLLAEFEPWERAERARELAKAEASPATGTGPFGQAGVAPSGTINNGREMFTGSTTAYWK